MDENNLSHLREQIDGINLEILHLLSRRGEIVEKIGRIKREKGMSHFSPTRESEILDKILSRNRGPFSNDVISGLFKAIFSASISLMDAEKNREFLYSRTKNEGDTVVKVGDVAIGNGSPVVIAGPCSVESVGQMERIAGYLKKSGVRLLRGGAFKPRTSPYTFQGLEEEGLKILKSVADRYGMYVVTEVMDTGHIEMVARHAHVLQVGARNMHNYVLLKELGRIDMPILLKRGFMSTLEEFLCSAEYILAGGNRKVILCERGIRTFERWTRNTLDISAIPILKRETHLPIIVDISHALGRCDVMIPIAKASLSAGADGIMVETHYNPAVALSDGDQQLTPEQFEDFYKAVIG